MRSTLRARSRPAAAALSVIALSATLAACQPQSQDSPTDSPTATASAAATRGASSPAASATGTPAGATPLVATHAASPAVDPSDTAASPQPAEPGTDGTTGQAEPSAASPTDGSASAAPTPTGSAGGAAPGDSTGGGAAPAGLENFYGQHLAWSECADSAGFQCATATVPLDYNNPTGQTVSIGLKRLPASDGRAELGTLFLNPGGPGLNGTEMVTAWQGYTTPEMHASYDLVGFDPRGVGSSTLLTCWGPDGPAPAQNNEQEAPGQQAPEQQAAGDQANGAADLEKLVSQGAAYASECRRHSEVPGLIDHMGAEDVARDLDVLRGAVGDQRLSYLGYSYGTSLGAAYAKLFPSHVGRVALDSAMDPGLTRADFFNGQQERRSYRKREYISYCLDQEGCPLTGGVDEAGKQLNDFLTGLDAEPLTVAQGGQTTQMKTTAATVFVTNLALARSEYWPALTKALSRAMTDHDGTELNRVGLLAESTGQLPEGDSEATARFNAVYAAVICADYPDTPEPTTPADAYCHGWGVTSNHAPEQIHASGAAPILVVGVTGDSQTPYPWSQSLAAQLDSGHLLTVEGFQHGGSAHNKCALSKVSDYLVKGTTPQDGAICPIEPLDATIAKELAK